MRRPFLAVWGDSTVVGPKERSGAQDNAHSLEVATRPPLGRAPNFDRPEVEERPTGRLKCLLGHGERYFVRPLRKPLPS